MKTHTHYDSTFRWKHTFLYGTQKQAEAYIEKHATPLRYLDLTKHGHPRHLGFTDEITVQARCWLHYPAAQSFVWIRHRTDYASIAHECLHVALDVFDHVGAKYDGDNSEALCYYVQSLIDAYIDGAVGLTPL